MIGLKMKNIILILIFTLIQFSCLAGKSDDEKDEATSCSTLSQKNELVPQSRKRNSMFLDRYQKGLERSQSTASLPSVERPVVGSLDNSYHSISMPKLERSFSGILTSEDQVKRELLSNVTLAEDIFLLTHSITNRLILAESDLFFQNHVEILRALRHRVALGYSKASEHVQMDARVNCAYYQDYADIYASARDPQEVQNVLQFMKGLQEAENLKTEVKKVLETKLFARLNPDQIEDAVQGRSKFLRLLGDIKKQLMLEMDKYPFRHAYGEKPSQNLYVSEALKFLKSKMEDLLCEDALFLAKKTLEDLIHFSSNEVSVRNAYALKSIGDLQLRLKGLLLRDRNYYADIKPLFEEVIGEIDLELADLNKPHEENSEDMSEESHLISEIAQNLIVYWNQPHRQFAGVYRMDAEAVIQQFSQIVEIFENAINHEDPLAYDPLHHFNLHYNRFSYWPEFSLYSHFIDNQDVSDEYQRDKRDAFNPFVFFPLNRDECLFLVEHHSARPKLKQKRDFIKSD
jgi:hypothetical protein